MKKAIVAFMVVAGMALMMVGCNDNTPAPKGPGAPATTPAPKAVPPTSGEK